MISTLQRLKLFRRNLRETPSIPVAEFKDFVGLLRRPRAVMMLVPAGSPVDSVISDLLPYLEKGDLIIDAGNSYFKDTNRGVN